MEDDDDQCIQIITIGQFSFIEGAHEKGGKIFDICRPRNMAGLELNSIRTVTQSARAGILAGVIV